jgi:hypothetical protein
MAMLKMLVIIAIAVITAPAVVGALANHYNPFAEFDNVSDEKLAVHKNLRSDVNKAALTGNKEAKFVVSQARRTTFSASNGTHRGHTASLNGEGIFESTTSRRLLDEGPMSDDDIVITLQKYANLNAGKRHNGKTRSGKFVAIVATDSSPAFEMLIANWACNLRRVGLHPLVWALDQATHLKLNRQQIGKVPIGSIFSQRLLSLQTPEVQALWQQSVNADKLPGESAYIAAVAFKPLVMYEVVRLGFDLLYLDVDIGLANDPRPWLLNNFRMHESDIQISLNYPFVDLVNTGVVYAPTSQPGAHFLLQLWVNHMQAQKCQGWECGDQEILSQVFSKNCKNWTRLRHDDAAVCPNLLLLTALVILAIALSPNLLVIFLPRT